MLVNNFPVHISIALINLNILIYSHFLLLNIHLIFAYLIPISSVLAVCLLVLFGFLTGVCGVGFSGSIFRLMRSCSWRIGDHLVSISGVCCLYTLLPICKHIRLILSSISIGKNHLFQLTLKN